MAQKNPINRVSEYACEAGEQAREVVNEHPLPSASFVFAVGVGVGIAAVVLLSESTRPTPASTAQRIGQQMLDAMNSVLPRNLS